MFARSHRDLHGLRASVERTRKLSDRVIGLGPFSLGLDGVLAWIPGLGFAYSVAAGGFLVLQAVRARARPATVLKMLGLLAADSLTDVIPIPLAPAVADMVFTGHKWAADALLKHLDETLYYEGTKAEAEADPAFRQHLLQLAEQRRAGSPPLHKRVIYLG
ncbi:MAG TPA: DUF4112 domain-containing protein [Caulobacteraceae bacterium]|jgi:hypothetical protein|nr:DUF4112 domain-containing protein [Caulobacteraceae bacterium]